MPHAQSGKTQTPYAHAGAFAAAEEPDIPVFCFSETAMQARLRRYLDGFPGETTYAVKCNALAPLLAALAAGGVHGFDVASVREIEQVRAIAPDALLHYHNPVKSRREIEAAYRLHGCTRFAVDCIEEIEKIHAIIGGDPAVELAVRFVLPRERGSSAHDFSTKFGAPEHECAALLSQAAGLGYAPVLTFHPGSQCHDPQVYVRHIEAAGRIAAAAGEAPVGVLNVGGGFPANYLLQTSPEPEAFFAAIDAAVDAAFPDRRPRLECEPGRGMAADCMSLLTRVKLVSADDVFLNDGIYGGLMEYYQAPDLRQPFRVWRDGVALDGPTRSFKTFGPTCDPLDVLPHRLDLPDDLREGDYIEFGGAGAYGPACVTDFNGYGAHGFAHVRAVLSL